MPLELPREAAVCQKFNENILIYHEQTHSTGGVGCKPFGSVRRISQAETKLVKPMYRKIKSGSRSCTRNAYCCA